MDIKPKFIEAWYRVKDEIDFIECAKKYGFNELEQKYIVCCVVGVNDNEHERCDALDIKYNFRPHRALKIDRDLTKHEELYYLTQNLLTAFVHESTNEGEIDKKQAANSDEIDVVTLLKGLIKHDLKPNEQVRALEVLQKLEDKRQGSDALLPWQRLWIEDIIPNMLASH